MSVRVRFAPSPTGALHIGGVRTALYNYLFAKKKSGIFILRVEDTDQGRFVPGAEAYILESLKWCGIEPTEGIGYGGIHEPYRQSERKDIYMTHAIQLINNDKAYYAFDTETDLEDMRKRLADAGVPAPKYDASIRMTMKNSLTLTAEQMKEFKEQNIPYVIRLKVDPGQSITFNDIVRGEVTFDSGELDDKVLIKGDGMPTYHMANVIDDHLMEITHVIRGEEWLSSTAHHLLLYQAFNWDHPEFAHLPLLMKPDGKGKLSKRDGAKFGIPVFPLSWKGETAEDSFEGFREYGFEPEAVINFLAFLGWNPGTEQEIFSLEQLSEAFDLFKVHKSGARFDMEKALWFNQQYIRKMPFNEVFSKSKELIKKHDLDVSDEKLYKIIYHNIEKIYLIKDILKLVKESINDDFKTDPKVSVKYLTPEVSQTVKRIIPTITPTPTPTPAAQSKMPSIQTFDYYPQNFENILNEKIKLLASKPKDIYPALRLIFSGKIEGQSVKELLEINNDRFDKLIMRFILEHTEVRILLCGYPGTGKSTFGEKLSRLTEFDHYDLEHSEMWPKPFLKPVWDTSIKEFINLIGSRKIILNWGFPVNCIPMVKEIESENFYIVWFYGDTSIAKHWYLKREGGLHEENFDNQINQIRSSNLPFGLAKNIIEVDVFDEQGNFLPFEVKWGKILEGILNIVKLQL